MNVDTPEKLPTVLSLCTGYGGLEIGLEGAVGPCRPLAYVEIEAFACANLVAKMEQGRMDPAPIWTDLKTLPAEPFRDRVDFLLGGYPCQPFSHAGRRGGADDPRHLWPHIARLIREVRPSFCFFENVEGHVSLGLSTVISDLEEMDYHVASGIFSAREVGAPHKRKRIYIMAYFDRSRRFHGQAQELATEAGLDALCQSRPSRSDVAHTTEPQLHEAGSGDTQEGGGAGQTSCGRSSRRKK